MEHNPNDPKLIDPTTGRPALLDRKGHVLVTGNGRVLIYRNPYGDPPPPPPPPE